MFSKNRRAGMQGPQIVNVDIREFTSGEPKERQRFAAALGNGLCKDGFVFVTGYRPLAPLEEYYSAMRRLFDLPAELKARYAGVGAVQRGYLPAQTELKPVAYGDSYSVFDHKEVWQIGRSRNLVPEVFPEWGTRSRDQFIGLERLGVVLLEAIGLFLSDSGYLLSLVLDAEGQPAGTHLMRAIHYPPLAEASPLEDASVRQDPGRRVRGGEHRDLNLITLLPQATLAGLEIAPREGDWFGVEWLDDAVLVNVGDMLDLMTAEHPTPLRAVLHRVVGNGHDLAAHRYSSPFFVSPHLRRPLRVLGHSHQGDFVRAFNEPIVEAGRFVWHRLRRSHPSMADVSYAEWMSQVQALL